MKNVALSSLLLSTLTISNSSSDVLNANALNAKGSPASTTSLVAPTIQNTTDPSTKKTTTTQPKGQDSDAGISNEESFGIFVVSTCVPSMLLTVCLARYRRTASGTTTNTQVDNQEQSADIIDINQEQSATPRTTTSSMTAETIGAGIEIQI